jgi:MinD-like ATPase involved in chromosome partitioning or flagellar assembly
VPRSAVAVCLPEDELRAVSAELTEAGYEPIEVTGPDELEALLGRRDDVGLALLDGETDFDATIEMYALLHEGGRNVASLMVVSSIAMERLSLAGRARVNAEFVTRPYSPASLRWRAEAMLIRAETLLIRDEAVGDEARGAILEGQVGGPASTATRGQLVIVFNPKGGVGKTTIAINTSAMLQTRKSQRVLLVDCDAVTGHVVTSLGMAAIPTVVDVWSADLETGANHSLAEIATRHSSGVAVLCMAQSPLHTEVLEPKRVAQAISAARATFDWVIVDMHPDYGPLNQVIFALADQILVPVTPDVPAIRAAVQFREVAIDLGLRDRLALVVNRANSGVSARDVEKVIGMSAIGKIRSAGMLFVHAANGGRSAVEQFPKASVVGDIENLADRLIAARDAASGRPESSGIGAFMRPVRDFLNRWTTQPSGRSG